MTRSDDSDESLEGLTPTALQGDPARPTVVWRDLRPHRLADPFFAETVRRAPPGPRTSMDRLEAFALARPGIPPNGFIFHGSRCGSTLLSQTLATLPGAIVVAEAPPVDAVLGAPVADDVRARWLRAIVGALGARRLGSETSFVLKLDAWHTAHLPLFARAFPGVPWVFVYRDPLDVLVSHAVERGMHMVPGLVDTRALGVDPGIFPGVTLDAYGAEVIGAIAEAALRGLAAGGGRLVHYDELPSVVEDDIAPRFGLPLSDRDRQAMRARSAFDAKRPGVPFTEGPSTKIARARAGARLRDLAERSLGDVHARLEAARAGEAVVVKALPRLAPAAPERPRLRSKRLPIEVDLAAIRADLARVAPEDYVRHFNDGYYEGDWSGVALRSNGGSVARILPDPSGLAPYADTPLLARSEGVRALLAKLRCPVRSARFLRLGPGSRILEHADLDLGDEREAREVRLHVAVVTNPDVEFVVDGAVAPMPEGELWYHDFSRPHRVHNRGATPRTHLVLDCVVDDWLRGLLEGSP